MTILTPSPHASPAVPGPPDRLARDRARLARCGGRPADAERVLSRYVWWCRRRGRHRHAAALAVELGYVCLLHGRVEAARSAEHHARQLSGSDEWTVGLLACELLAGWVALAGGPATLAESRFRSAAAAAESYPDRHLRDVCTMALACCLLEQQRCAEAGDLAASCDAPCSCAPEWPMLEPHACGLTALDVRARLAALAGHDGDMDRWRAALDEACEATGERGRAALGAAHYALTAARGEAHAAAEACARGVRAARRMHAPLLALALRLAHAEALAGFGRPADARRRLACIRRSPLAATAAVRSRVARIQSALDRQTPDLRPGSPAFVQLAASDVLHILRVCAEHDGDRQTLAAVCQALRSALGAAGVAVFAQDRWASPLASAGSRIPQSAELRSVLASGRASTVADVLAVRQAIVFVHCGRETCGALFARWCTKDVPMATRHLALLHSAAAAVAPVVRGATTAMPCPEAASGILADLAGPSAAVDRLRRDIARAAAAPFPVLIQGESGCGKELVAKAIHAGSARRGGRFCAVNCAALPDELCEAELFGHARGAFTGAAVERPGLFEEADGGTLLLDEVGELSARAQAKLLRVIQEGEVRRLGENVHRRVDPRIVAATNRPLQRLAEDGRFRHDLLFRLDVLRIVVPPLRERRDDIPSLAQRIWKTAAGRVGSRAELTPAAVAALGRYGWPGNVRELQNVLYALAASAPRTGRVGADRLPASISGVAECDDRVLTLEAGRREFERTFVREALARSGWRRSHAAAQLGVTRQGLTKLLARLDLDARVEPDVTSP